LSKVLGAASFLGIVIGLYGAFIYAPTEATMGPVQRIFYFHVSVAFAAFLAFGIVFIGSIGYLITRKRGWDNLGAAAAEIGILFCTLVLLTGPLWAKPAWGTWWTWDPRLTTTLVLWLIYVGYIMLRNTMEDPSRRALVSSVFGIIGFIDVPIVFMSVRLWRTIHPVVIDGDGFSLSPEMVATTVISVVAFAILTVFLLVVRMRLQHSQDEVERLKAEILAERTA
jgi:heme exporter protein C